MNTTSEDKSRVNLAAQEGDIDGLYTVIQENPHVLEDIDSIPFVDTPLHVAASVGKLEFATEVMTLKPSFALKLNPQGLTPIHLALQNGHERMVLHFVSINKDLVRVKGRKGRTALHLASEKGEIKLLIEFLLACPDCIEDVTVRKETALHIAVRCGQYETLQVLLGWLMKTSHTGALKMERTILNWKDVEGNTVLHLSSRENNFQMVELLVKTAKLNLNAKNYEERSAFDVATNQEIRTVLLRSGANLSATNNVVTYANTFKSKMTLRDKITTSIRRIRCDITENQRNIYLIISTLIITTTYETVLSPPGGLYQVNATDVNTNSNSTELYGGTPVVPEAFRAISGINALSILVSTTTIWILTPTTSLLGSALMLPILFLSFSYILSVITVSGSIVSIIFCLFPLMYLALCIFLMMVCSNIKKLLAGLKYDLGQSCYSQNY